MTTHIFNTVARANSVVSLKKTKDIVIQFIVGDSRRQ